MNVSNSPLSPDVRTRVLAAALDVRAAGQPVPEVPAITPVEAYRRAADALDRTLATLGADAWGRPAIRDLDVQGLVGHLAGVEEDVRRAVLGDPAVADASHVESTQAAAERQAGRSPAQTLSEWRDATSQTFALLAGVEDLDRAIALHGMRLPLGSLLLVRAFELWVHENDIRLSTGQPASAPDPPALRLMTTLAARLLPGAARRGGLLTAASLRLVLTGHGGGTWDLVLGDDAADDADDGESPRLSIVADAVGFCRLAADRIRPADLGASVIGSADLAACVLAATATLALD
ncbi:maleylpyruvate isomerase family mycothiol-dependent enzyme [Trebonia kvetii]|uniref:Maleylpyruvate isomerase family mycothiol-dependent enzyme n=1 Tax=Trebonia kvetii TaxID=2480626 RepID=A0A6P2C3C2_9ACTN|nr:maleylpyruvate isomerase family mycothiol-dependent enzyme [Trebonia kvetii]TVZ04013.1 maleylpyruvate isomerase family mycothiol-dependent enzyme [Trebonia kvetii]